MGSFTAGGHCWNQAKVDGRASRQAISAFEAAIRKVKLAEAEAEIALANLRRQYEANYLSARKDYGKLLAERLFPRLSKTAPVMVAEAA